MQLNSCASDIYVLVIFEILILNYMLTFFAVHVPTERVSILLGHNDLDVTEKHYSLSVRGGQEQLEADVRQSWGCPVHRAGDREGCAHLYGHEKSGFRSGPGIRFEPSRPY